MSLLPLQLPPQVEPSLVQTVPWTGWPLPSRVHVPLLVPVRLHALHSSVQAALQHTPSAQNPLLHSPGPEQASPCGLLPHVPPDTQ